MDIIRNRLGLHAEMPSVDLVTSAGNYDALDATCQLMLETKNLIIEESN